MKYLTFKQKIKHLPVFSRSMLSTLTKKADTLNVQITMWMKKGLVSRLRKGLYVLGKEEREIKPSLFYLANQIFLPSYISLESALAYYGLIPEFAFNVTSVTTRKTCRFENEFGVFTYQHIKTDAYGGFALLQEQEDYKVLIATPEKAIVDFLYLNLSRIKALDGLIFTESFRFQNMEKLSVKKIKCFAKEFGSKKLISVTELLMREIIK